MAIRQESLDSQSPVPRKAQRLSGSWRVAEQVSRAVIYGGSLAFGVGVGTVAGYFGAYDATFGRFLGSDSDQGMSQPFVDSAHLQLIHEQEGLNPEVAKKVADSLVRFTFVAAPGYSNLKLMAATCNAFVVAGADGRKRIATASHCIPESVQSGKDGQWYGAVDTQGRSIIIPVVLDARGKARQLKLVGSYPITSWDKPVSDLALFGLDSGERVDLPALEISVRKPQKADLAYRLSLDPSGALTASRLTFFQEDPDYPDRISFLDLSPALKACQPGSSGSVIVNAEGKVLGLQFHHQEFFITEGFAADNSLSPSMVGRIASNCTATRAQSINNLLAAY